MEFILELFLILTIGVIPHLFSTIYYIFDPTYHKRVEQISPFEMLLSRGLSSLAKISAVLFIAYQKPDRFLSIGIQPSGYGNNITAIFYGLFGMSVVVLLFGLIQKMLLVITKKPSPPRIDLANPAIMDTLKYRDIWERIARLTVIPLGVFEEELVLRGYLVLFLGGLTGNYILWAMISIILTVVVHLYQGLNFRTIATHLLYAGLFVGLIILTKNILAPIAVHLFINFLSFLKIWAIAEKQEEPISKPIHSGRKKLAYLVFIIANVVILFFLAAKVFLKFEEPPDFGRLFSFKTLFIILGFVFDCIFK